MQNLGQFLKHYSNKHKGRVAYEIKRGYRTQRFSFEDIHSLALKTANFLSHQGLKKGDKVAIWAPNMPEYPILYFGIWAAGCVAVPIDVRTTEDTLKVFLTKAKCKVGFKGRFVPGDFKNLVKESFYLEDLVSLALHLKGINVDLSVEQHDLAEIAFTSGTTGTPKGVMLTHGNFLSDVEALTKAFPLKIEYRTLSLLPLSHAFEQIVDFLALYQSGIKVTYLERTNRLTILKALRKNKITSVVLVPQALQLLMTGIENEVENQGKQKLWSRLNTVAPKLPIWARRFLFRSVHQKFGGNLIFFGCGSAPLNLKLAQKWENLGIEVFEGYGATETTAALTINTPSAKRLGSVGKVLPDMKARINPKTSEIEAQGPSVSPGYFEDEEKTKKAFYNNWYHTGDVGEFDEDGYLYITGREAFRIVLPNGQKVYPEDIENKLNAHHLVVESCVIGIKRPEGERVHAVIITKYPKKLDQIIIQTNAKLASHEQIMEASLWKDTDFPRTPILKIDRRKVLEEVLGKEVEKPKIKVKTEDKLINIISLISNIPPSRIKESSTLATDLKLDSLQRVELLSLVEQELGVALSEVDITPQTTISNLRTLFDKAEIISEEIPVNELVYSGWMSKLRNFLQDFLAFPLHSLFVPLSVKGKENLGRINLPAIFYFNHIGIMDGLCVLRVLPSDIREKIVIAVNADIWKDWRRYFIQNLGGGFPFDKKERVKASLELMGEFLDKGYSVLMAPEGTFTEDGRIMDFKPGAGFMAVSMQVSVIPIKIDISYREIFPPLAGAFLENLPKKRKRIWVKIGKPIVFLKDADYEVATSTMKQALENL